jgi:hypothetical protein
VCRLLAQLDLKHVQIYGLSGDVVRDPQSAEEQADKNAEFRFPVAGVNLIALGVAVPSAVDYFSLPHRPHFPWSPKLGRN